MINSIFTAALIFLLPAILFILAKYAFRFPKEKRWFNILHFPAIVLTLITVIAGYSRIVFLIDQILSIEWVEKVLTLLFARANPNTASAVVFLVLSNCFVAVVEIGYLAITHLIIALYNLLGRLIRKIKSKEESDSQRAANELIGKVALQDSVITGWLVNMLYDFDAEPVCVRKNTVVTRQWITVMKHSFICLYFVLLVLIIARPTSAFSASVSAFLSSGLRYTFILPSLIYVLLSQAQFFMLGTENVGFTEEFESDKITSRKTGQYDALIDNLSKSFDSSLIAFLKQPSSADTSIPVTDVTDAQLQKCSPDERRLLMSMCHSLRLQNVELNEHMIDALITIISNKSLIINDYCLGSFFPCLAIFLNHYLAIGKKALIICPDELAVSNTISSLNDRFLRINDLDPVWKVADILTARSDKPVDVLVCTDTTLLNENVMRENKGLLSQISLCVMTDSYRLYSRNHLVKRMILDRLGSSDTDIRFVCFTGEGSASFRDTLAADFNQDIEYFENIKTGNNTCVMVWRSESNLKPQKVFGLENEPYFDIAFCLATSAVSYGLPTVSIVPDNKYPLTTDLDVIGYCANENARKDIKKVADAVRSDGFCDFSNEDCAFIAVHDTNYNLANLFELWSKYSGENYTVLNFISPSYILRDYFASNMLYFFSNPSAIEIFVPYEEGLRESELTALLLRMASEPVSEIELMSIAHRMNLDVDQVEDFLSIALEKVLKERFHGSIYQFFTFERKLKFSFTEHTSEYSYEYYIRFSGADTLNSSETARRVSMVEFPNGNCETLPIAHGDLINYYLPGQYQVFSSSPGETGSKDKNRTEICRITGVTDGKISAAPDTRQEYRPQYAQISQITLYDVSKPSNDNIYTDDHYTLERFSANASRHVRGYYELCGGNNLVDISSWNRVSCSHSIDRKNINVLHVRIPGDFGAEFSGISALLCRMFNELLVSLFPYTWQNLYVCRYNGTEATDLTDAEARITELDATLLGDGLLKSDENNIHLYFVEFSSIEYGMINVIQNDFRKLLKLVVSYLNWANNTNESKYLFYGLDECPGIFAPIQLEALITGMGIQPISVEHIEQEFSGQLFVNGRTTCSFCHRDTYLTATKLSDGRCLCPDCEKTTISRQREITKLYKEVRTEMESTYGIKLPKWLLVGFKSASSIKKRLGERSGGRVLGFYQPKLRTLWVERGGPRTATKSTIIHELTHCWQFENLSDTSDVQKLEGHSVFVEIDLMKKKGDKAYAQSLENEYLQRDDIYGEGYRQVKQEMIVQGFDNCFELITKDSEI